MDQNSREMRILSIVPSRGGLGFAVIEDQELVIWGNKTVKGKGKGSQELNDTSLERADALIRRWQPTVLVIEDANAKGSWRRARIKEMVRRIARLGRRHKINVELLSRSRMMKVFFSDKRGTKYALAEYLAQLYPEQLAHQLPPEKRIYESEKHVMGGFYAIAFGIGFSLMESKEDNDYDVLQQDES